jgi:hypothetical protein
MWIEQRRQQHRVYWRKPGGGKDYEAFPSGDEAAAFVRLCREHGREHGREQVLARWRTAEPTEPVSEAAAADPAPAGVSLRWLAEQYLASGTRPTRSAAPTTGGTWIGTCSPTATSGASTSRW